METLKKQTNVRMKVTDKYSWRNVKDKNIGGDGKETDKYWWSR